MRPFSPRRWQSALPFSRRTPGERPYVAWIDRPTQPVVTAHTLQRARVAGWVGRTAAAHTGLTDAMLCVRLGDAAWQRYSLGDTRPDVVANLGRSLGIVDARGFSRYIELPPLDRPLPMDLAVDVNGQMVDAGRYQISHEPDLYLLDTFTVDPPVMGELARRHLHGRGLEFGALHSPLQVAESCCMRYADRFVDEELAIVFPELLTGYRDRLVHVDFKVDLDADDLRELGPNRFDFFVANGVLEHLANPLLFLANVSGLMRPGSVLFVAVPDRDFAFDSRRPVTPFEHLWGDYARHVCVPDDDHLVEMLEGLREEIPADPVAREALFAHYRRHSYHVHVWNEASFGEFLRRANERVPLGLEQVAGCGPVEGEGNLIAVLRKTGG